MLMCARARQAHANATRVRRPHGKPHPSPSRLGKYRRAALELPLLCHDVLAAVLRAALHMGEYGTPVAESRRTHALGAIAESNIRAFSQRKKNCHETGTARGPELRGGRDCEETGAARKSELQNERAESDSARSGAAAPRFPFSCAPLAVPLSL